MKNAWRPYYSRTFLLAGSNPTLTALCAQKLGDLLCTENDCECAGKTWRLIGCNECLISIYTPIPDIRERGLARFAIYISIDCTYPKELVKSINIVLSHTKNILECKQTTITLHS